jgi:xanthine dehydrogenase accessory factor
MFDLAAQVLDWLGQDRPVMVARLIETRGFSSAEPAAAVAATPGQQWAGRLLAGAADHELADLLRPGPPRVAGVTVSDHHAQHAGLSCGGLARVLVQPAQDIGDDTWRRLASGDSCCLVTDFADHRVGPTRTVTPDQPIEPSHPAAATVTRLYARGSSLTSVVDENGVRAVVTALWPSPTLVVVGDGLIAEALADVGRLLGWRPRIVDGVAAPERLSAGLRAGDVCVVLSHDLDISGRALRGALHGAASYVGALGSRRTQAARAAWLGQRGVGEDLVDRIHGPAGFDIGALSPHEIAVAIVAEAMAARTGHAGTPLRERSGSIHPAGVAAPPPRYPAS